MRFQTGDMVEVMNSKEVPVSWRVAEILSRSGDTYTIQYVCYPGMAKKLLVEVVPRKLLRPCPSSLQSVKSFITGDIVEVFHQYSWKIAVVLNVLGGKKESRNNKIYHKVSTCKNRYLVKLLGCAKELAIDRSKIRMRQTWHDGKWAPLTKVFFETTGIFSTIGIYGVSNDIQFSCFQLFVCFLLILCGFVLAC